jgi:hypothetical protein
MTPPTPTPVAFEVKNTAPTILIVTGSDGVRYEVQVAVLVMAIMDTGLKNPIDQMPVFGLTSQLMTQIRRKTDA